jgi:hypothetical protein
MARNSRISASSLASNLHPQERTDQELFEPGQSGDCEENEAEFEIRLFVCEYWEFVFDWVSGSDIFS